MTNYTFEPDECRMCGKKTKAVVNINMKAVAIYNNCCSSVMLQHAKWLADKLYDADLLSAEEAIK